jgi:hypothetical protein
VLPLHDGEVVWDETDSRRFTLHPRPGRTIADMTAVEVRYSVTTIHTTLRAVRTLSLSLRPANGPTDRLDEAEALVGAVIALNRSALASAARDLYEDGDYSAGVEITGLAVTSGSRPAADTRLLTLQVHLELKATRALRADEGRPIEHIRTPGRPPDPRRRIDIEIGVDA